MKHLLLFGFLCLTLTFSIKVEAQVGPGNALHFDGTDDYVSMSLPTHFMNLANTDFTVETWVYPETSSFARVFFVQNTPSNFASISITNMNTVHFYLTADSNNYSVGTVDPIPLNQWSHIAVVRDAALGQSDIYVNGVPQTLDNSSLLISSTGNNTAMTLGAKTDGTQNFPGLIDGVRIWDHARQECEITFGRSGKVDGNENGLLHAYLSDQGVAGDDNTGVSSLLDAHTSANDGTLTNFALQGSSSNFLASTAIIDHSFSSFPEIVQTGAMLDVLYSTGNYQWLNCNQAFAEIPGETSAQLSLSTTGQYAVRVTENSCIDTSACINVISLGQSENDKPSVQIGPNPVQNQINIIPAGGAEIQRITLMDLSGKTLLNRSYQTESVVQLRASQYAKGIYLIQVESSGGKIQTERLVIP